MEFYHNVWNTLVNLTKTHCIVLLRLGISFPHKIKISNILQKFFQGGIKTVREALLPMDSRLPMHALDS